MAKFGSNFTCPVCHSDKLVAGNKVVTDKHCWHKCFAGDTAHGDVQLESGQIVTWPHPLWFTNTGLVDPGNGHHLVHIKRQEWIENAPKI